MAVTIKEEFTRQLLELTLHIDRRNQVGRMELRSYAGKTNHVATLVWPSKPFLDCLWVVCESRTRSHAVHGCVWVSQFRSSFRWSRACMLQQGRSKEAVQLVCLIARAMTY